MGRLILLAIIVGMLTSVNVKAQCNDQLSNECALNAGDNAVYLKDFRAKLKRAKRNEAPPTASFQVLLNKGVHYRFSICNAKEFEGEGILQLYDSQKLIQSSFDMTSGKLYPAFDFICRKTAIYNIYIYFKDGKDGCAVGIQSMIK